MAPNAFAEATKATLGRQVQLFFQVATAILSSTILAALSYLAISFLQFISGHLHQDLWIAILASVKGISLVVVFLASMACELRMLWRTHFEEKAAA